MKFRKKPVVIDAIRIGFGGIPDLKKWVVEFNDQFYDHFKIMDNGSDGVTIKIVTLEGEMNISPGDWVIRGVNGEYYPCKPDIFEKTYEPETQVN